MLTIAVSKGRIYEDALPLLAEAGITVNLRARVPELRDVRVAGSLPTDR